MVSRPALDFLEPAPRVYRAVLRAALPGFTEPPSLGFNLAVCSPSWVGSSFGAAVLQPSRLCYALPGVYYLPPEELRDCLPGIPWSTTD